MEPLILLALVLQSSGQLTKPNYCTVDPAVWTLELEADAIEVRVGETLSLHWSKSNGRWGEYMPPSCLSDWQVSDEHVAALSADRRFITISKAAKPGSIVTVSTRFAGEVTRISLRVIAADDPVLVGGWQIVGSEQCGKVPAELWFGGGGQFSFTFPEHMAETMRSGAGSYSWDRTTGRLSLRGIDATAARSGNALTIKGISFSSDGHLQATHCVTRWRSS